jgi:exopolysaccharide biosynthesis polyprenyl glycosylphosphotransferase
MIRLFLQQYQKRALILLIGDILLITLSINIILFQPSLIQKTLEWQQSKIILINGILLGITLLSLYILGLYDIYRIQRAYILLISLIITFGIVFVLYSALSYFIISLRPGKAFILLYISLAAFFLFLWRLVNNKYFHLSPQRVLFVGNDEIIQKLKKILGEMGNYYTIAGHWHRQSHNPTLPHLASYIQQKQIDLIVYSSHSEVLKRLANPLCNLRFQQKNIHEARSFYQFLTGKYPIFFVDDFGLLINSEREFFFPRLQTNIKRVFDILFSLICLPLAAPLVLLAGILIKLESRGPIFFIQERLGLNETPFKLIKLRTMIMEAEKDGPQWAKDNDSRITFMGKILRTTRLDEFPQLINVLKGEMSIVGPRPLRKVFADELAEQIPFYRLRFLAKPGLTGWAQVCYGYANNLEDHRQRTQYDLFYIVHQSIWLDLIIIFKTIRVVLWRQGGK